MAIDLERAKQRFQRASADLKEAEGAEKAKKTGARVFGVLAVLALVFVLLRFIFYVGTNMFNVVTLFNHGGAFYVNNVITAHTSSHIILSKPKPLYGKIPKIENMDDTNYIIRILPKGQVLKNTGYINKKDVSWLAVELGIGDKLEKGYLLIPHKIGYDPHRIDSISGEFINQADKKTSK